MTDEASDPRVASIVRELRRLSPEHLAQVAVELQRVRHSGCAACGGAGELRVRIRVDPDEFLVRDCDGTRPGIRATMCIRCGGGGILPGVVNETCPDCQSDRRQPAIPAGALVAIGPDGLARPAQPGDVVVAFVPRDAQPGSTFQVSQRAGGGAPLARFEVGYPDQPAPPVPRPRRRP